MRGLKQMHHISIEFNKINEQKFPSISSQRAEENGLNDKQ